MKLLSAIFAMVFAVNVAFAVNTPDETGPSGFGDASGDFEYDFSYSYCEQEYKAFVICPIDCYSYSESSDFGWINPDGVKNIEAYKTVFVVTGGNGWPFEAKATFGNLTNGVHQASSFTGVPGGKATDVYITDVEWYLGNNVISNSGNFSGKYALSGTMESFGQDDSWNYDGGNYERSNDNACNGKAVFTFKPGILWAEPDAYEGYYMWDLMLEVDYLTFVQKNGFPVADQDTP